RRCPNARDDYLVITQYARGFARPYHEHRERTCRQTDPMTDDSIIKARRRMRGIFNLQISAWAKAWNEPRHSREPCTYSNRDHETAACKRRPNNFKHSCGRRSFRYRRAKRRTLFRIDEDCVRGRG